MRAKTVAESLNEAVQSSAKPITKKINESSEAFFKSDSAIKEFMLSNIDVMKRPSLKDPITVLEVNGSEAKVKTSLGEIGTIDVNEISGDYDEEKFGDLKEGFFGKKKEEKKEDKKEDEDPDAQYADAKVSKVIKAAKKANDKGLIQRVAKKYPKFKERLDKWNAAERTWSSGSY